MGKKEKFAARLSDLLPDTRKEGLTLPGRETAVREGAEALARRDTAEALARIRYAEKDRLKRRAKTAEAAARSAERLEAVEAVGRAVLASPSVPEVQEVVPEALARSVVRLQGTSRPELDALLAKLGIDLSIRLTKADTANLLACLLTCSEAQLNALRRDPRTPVAVKTVIVRLLDDMRSGSMSTVDRLWDRVFGTRPLEDTPLPASAAALPGLLPDMPVSREAYLLIKETLVK